MDAHIKGLFKNTSAILEPTEPVHKLRQSPTGCLGKPGLEAHLHGLIQASIPEDEEAKDVMQPY